MYCLNFLGDTEWGQLLRRGIFFFMWLQNKFDFLSKENRRIFVSIRNYLDNKVLRN